MAELRAVLERLEGRPYPAYRDLRGPAFVIDGHRLTFDHVQPDPFAAPSRLRVEVAPRFVLPAEASATADARRATADFLHRGLRRRLGAERGVRVAPLGQEVLERTAVELTKDGKLVVRFEAELPASGRRIRGRAAAALLGEHLPEVLQGAIGSHDAAALTAHVHAVEDQVALRAVLPAHGLIAFLADGSQLARRSGVDEQPLASGVPLLAPAALAVTMIAPHAGTLRGLGIPVGVTVVVGGGYHGKSTLLAALARGVYDHIPGDGRERCVTVPAAVMIRAEDGRPVRGVDLRPFINHLPLGRSTEWFETDDASGSTSQAANIVEALEVGATVLLVDEDTAATNFMVRDARMRRLVPAVEEPITPFLDRVGQLAVERGVSSVLVMGGAGDYLDVADRVIRMVEYRPVDATADARRVAEALPLGTGAPRAPSPWPASAPRRPDLASLDPARTDGRGRVRAREMRTITFGAEEIDLSALAQIVEPGQCRMIGDVLAAWGHEGRGSCHSLGELLDQLEAQLNGQGLSSASARGFGDRTRARRFEIAAALNRLASLRVLPG